RGRQPCARPLRDPVGGPRAQRLRVRVLGALLGEVEVTGEPGGGRVHQRPVAAVRLGDRFGDRRRDSRAPPWVTTRPISPPVCPGVTSYSSLVSAMTWSRSAASSR